MQIFKRDSMPPPSQLASKSAARARNVLLNIFSDRSARAAQTRVSLQPLVIETPELSAAAAAVFNQRCAFCESKTELAVYRFRPIGEAGPSDAAPDGSATRSHLYYSWLANAWENIYPICGGCRPLEPTRFPVRTTRCPLPSNARIQKYALSSNGLWGTAIDEQPILIDPCGTSNLREYLSALPNGELVGLRDRGSVSIAHFNLNRPDLVEARKAAFGAYFRLLLDMPHSPAMPFDFPALEFGGGWYLLLCQIALKLSVGERKPVLSPERIDRFFKSLGERKDYRMLIEEAFADLRENPAQVTAARARGLFAEPEHERPTQFTICNFKSIPDLQITLNAQSDRVAADQTPLAPALMILGENAAGKSSILEAMALALIDGAVREDLPAEASELILDPIMMGGTLTSGKQSSVAVQYEGGLRRRLVLTSDQFLETGASRASGIPVFAYGAFRLYLDGERRQRPASAVRSLFDPAFILPNPDRWLASLIDDPRFFEVARALRFVLALDQDFDVIEIDRVKQTCALVVRGGNGAGQVIRTPLSKASSGFRSILAMVCDVMRGLLAKQTKMSATLAQSRAVVLIDEIEAHLHPRWKMRIVEGLRRALPNVTFIVTTHDPLCLRGMASDEVIVLRRRFVELEDGAAGVPVVIESVLDLPAIETLTVEQLLTSDFFELLSTDASETQLDLAKAADLLAVGKGLNSGGADAVEQERLKRELHLSVRAQIRRALPVGSTEVERLVQEAVEAFLVKRRTIPASGLANLREQTRSKIIEALAGL
jgi:ABC-type cobalamin/Fe3+-siderophores transport system ATPase subunit